MHDSCFRLANVSATGCARQRLLQLLVHGSFVSVFNFTSLGLKCYKSSHFCSVCTDQYMGKTSI